VDRFRELWNFDDLDGSEARFRTALVEESSQMGRAEILTQLARVEGLRGAFDEGERLIEEAEVLAGANETALTRIDLERGRLRRSSGNSPAALPLFVSAFERARVAGEFQLAADAAHMAALASANDEDFRSWTQRGIDLVESADPSDRYWVGPLLNNLGWHHYEADRYEDALDSFRRALDERERDPTNRQGIEIALYCVAKALRALGRAAEGLPLLERAVFSAEENGRPDPWIHEELSETYTVLGREGDAREHAEEALRLFPDADPGFAAESDRANRLRKIAGEAAHGP
jgi:tetratricopeptide (TPR) repeat protein